MKNILLSLLGLVTVMVAFGIAWYHETGASPLPLTEFGLMQNTPLQPTPQYVPATAGEGGVLLAVENQLQYPALPNGCEATSLSILLRYYGFYTDNIEIAYHYLPRQDFGSQDDRRTGPHPDEAYAGDPASSQGGYYCYAPALVRGAAAFLEDAYVDADILNLTGAGAQELLAQLDAGAPVIVWCTMDYGPARLSNSGWLLADGSEYTPYANLHCMVLAGYDSELFYLCDPLQEGVQAVPREVFAAGFEALGSQAVAIRLL